MIRAGSWWCLLGIALFAGACSPAPSASVPSPRRPPGMGIVFEGVTVRQYRLSTPVLQVSAPRLQWDESQSVLEAPLGVSGTIDPSLWERKMEGTAR